MTWIKLFSMSIITVFVLNAHPASGNSDLIKVALVIGNSDYASVPKLKNPQNDAEDLSTTLENIGFEVTTAFNLDQGGMLKTLRGFQSKARASDIALIYYAGHGIEVGKQNYLIPTDALLQADRDVPFETVELDNAVLAASGASQLSIVILDACRNNPFSSQMTRTAGFRSVGRGLAEVEPQGNTLVAFAAKAGTVAADGDGRNSPYAKALIDSLSRPQVEIGLLFREVRDKVLSKTRGSQEPFFYGSLSSEKLYLNNLAVEEKRAEPMAAAPTQTVVQVPEAINPDLVNIQTQAAIWSAIKDSTDPEVFRQFVVKFPDSPFTTFADVAIKRLESSVDVARLSQPPSSKSSKTSIETEPVTPQVATRTPDTSAGSVAKEQVKSEQIRSLTKDEIKEIQEKLTIIGLRPGPIDGIAGQRTARAVGDFEQKFQFLENEGQLSPGLLARLRSEVSQDAVDAFRVERQKRFAEAAERRRRAAAAAAAEKQRQDALAAKQQELLRQQQAAAEAEAKRKEERKERSSRREASDDDDDDDRSSSGGGSGGKSGF